MKEKDDLEGSGSEMIRNPSEASSQKEPERPKIIFNIDASPANADWAKRHWDLPRTLKEWQSPLKSDAQLKSEFEKIISLPVGRAMPESLIAELRAEYGEDFVPKYLDKPTKKWPQGNSSI